MLAEKFVNVLGILNKNSGPSNSVIFVNENENENYQKRKNNDSVNEN